MCNAQRETRHWEADTVVFGRGKTKVCFATLAERMTGCYIAIKIPNRNGESMAKAIIEALGKLQKGAGQKCTNENLNALKKSGAN